MDSRLNTEYKNKIQQIKNHDMEIYFAPALENYKDSQDRSANCSDNVTYFCYRLRPFRNSVLRQLARKNEADGSLNLARRDRRLL